VGTIEAVGLLRNDLPTVYRAASDTAGRNKRRSLRWSSVQLVLLAIGSLIGGVQTTMVGRLDLGGLVATGALLLSLLPAMWLAVANPQRSWYRSRSGAESIKTLSWRYAVRALPFADADSDDRLRQDLANVCSGLPEITWSADPIEATPRMRALRDAPLAERRRVYVECRIDSQRAWYHGRARSFARAARWWTVVALVSTVLGLGAGFLRTFDVISYDGLGAACALAASATAWLQLKQYRPLVTAYSLVAVELATVRAMLADIDEETHWATVTHEAEEAISREHSMWLARREAV
jgi:hypothetical protein